MFNFLKSLFFNKKDAKSDFKEKADNKIDSKPIYKETVYKEKENETELKKICVNCKEELKGEESARYENLYYIVCSSCKFVNKIINNDVVKPSDSMEEISKAYELFAEANHSPVAYSIDGKEMIDAKQQFCKGNRKLRVIYGGKSSDKNI